MHKSTQVYLINMRTVHVFIHLLLVLRFCDGILLPDLTWKTYITSLLDSSTPQTQQTLVSVITQKLLQIHRATAHCLTHDGNSYRYPPVFDMTRSPCGVIHTVTPPVESITWNISVHNPFYINITLTRINLTDSVEGCRVESLQLVWGEGLRSHRICGVRLPYIKYIDSSHVKVQYSTDGGSRGGMFSIYYQVLPKMSQRRTRHVYINLEDDNSDLETDEMKMRTVTQDNFPMYYFIDITNVFARTSGSVVQLSIRVLPSLVIELRVQNANSTSTNDILGLRCHDGTSTTHPQLGANTLPDLDITTKFTSGSFVNSTAFVMTCTLQHVSCFSGQCRDVKFHHRRLPNENMRELTVGSFTKNRLPNTKYCNSHLCLLNITTRSDTSVKFTLTHLTLPNIDHSKDCLYEGVAIYDGKKHDFNALNYYSDNATRLLDQLIPIVRICGKVRQTIRAGTKEDYLVNTVVSTGNSLIVAFYSFHQSLAMGKLHFSTDVSHCQGFYAFCGQITKKLKEYSSCTESKLCTDFFDEIQLTRYYKDVSIYHSPGREIPVVERDANLVIKTKNTHTYNVVAIRPTSCAVIQYFPLKVYPTGRAKKCTISMIRARDTGSGVLNITVDHLSEYSNQCTQLSPSLMIDTQWTLLSGPGTSQSYVINDLVPQCSQVSAHVTQTESSIIDLVQTVQTKVSKEYIANTFLGSTPKLNKYVHSLKHTILMNESISFSQFGIGHVKSLANEYFHAGYNPEGHHQLQTVIVFWTEHCTIHMSIILVYELANMEFPTDMYKLRFNTKLQPKRNLTFTQPYFYFRRYIIMQMHTIISKTSSICKVCFSIDISRQYGVLKMHEEMRWVNTKVSLPAHVSQFNQVYIVWGYTSLSW